MDNSYKIMTLASELTKIFDAKNINYPYLQIPEGYEIAVIFPFTGATARFLIRKVGNTGQGVSVYLDTQEVLGYYGGESYWEALLDDTERFAMADTEGLMKAIIKYLNPNNKRNV